MHATATAFPAPLQVALLWVAIAFAAVKVASTLWLVRQPDATTVTATRRGRIIYYLGSKVATILIVAPMLARACLQGNDNNVRFWSVVLAFVVVAVIVVTQQRAAGKWFGLAHGIKQTLRQHRTRIR